MDYLHNDVEYSVVVPVYNEEENLRRLFPRLSAVMDSLGKSYEIVFVDDGSSDGSFGVLRDLCGLHPRGCIIRALRLTRNFGQPAAVAAGLDSANGKIVITIDADLEMPPEEIPKLLDKMDEGYEVVFGVFTHRKHSLFRRAGSAFSKWTLSKVMSVDTTNMSGFKAIRADVVQRLNMCGERTRFLAGLLSWVGASVGIVEVEHQHRGAGKSSYGVFKLVALWANLVTSFTNVPLRIATMGGMVLGAIGLVLALFYLVRYAVAGFGVPGFATIVILLLVFSGIQLFCLGIVGEYVGKLNTEVRHRPRYMIRDELCTGQADTGSSGEQWKLHETATSAKVGSVGPPRDVIGRKAEPDERRHQHFG